MTKKDDGPKKNIDELVTELEVAIEEEVEVEKFRWTRKFDSDENLEDSSNTRTIHFGTIPNPVSCNMVFTLPLIFWLKPN